MEVTVRLLERREGKSSSQSGAGDDEEGAEVHVESWCGMDCKKVGMNGMRVKIGSSGVFL
jgi:hypothetical protein